jgi:hypothetical protein
MLIHSYGTRDLQQVSFRSACLMKMQVDRTRVMPAFRRTRVTASLTVSAGTGGRQVMVETWRAMLSRGATDINQVQSLGFAV